MIKIAVVGAGIIGRRHIEAIQASPSCHLCAVCDVRQETAASFGVPYVTDYRKIPSDTEAEAVILNLPHWLHAEAAVFFLEHGLHVLVEKPMANTVSECDRMLEAACRSGKKLAVGHLQRFFEANRRVRELVRAGELGSLCMMQELRSINYFDAGRPGWFLDRQKAGGGILMNYGAHALDKLFYVTGQRPEQVHAVVGNRKNSADIEAHAQLLVKLADGTGAAMTFSGCGSCGYETCWCFTDGALKVVNGTELWRRTDGVWQREQLPPDRALPLQLEEFCRLLRDEPSELPDAAYGRDIIAVIEQAYQ